MSLLNRSGPEVLRPTVTPRRSGFQPMIAAGALLLLLALGGLLSNNAHAAFLYHGTLLVANRGGTPPSILRINTANDTVVQTITQADVSDPNNVISDVQVDPITGNIFVAVDLNGNNPDPALLNVGGTGEVVVFDPSGVYIRTVPLPDDGPGNTAIGQYAPLGIDVDTDGSIWATRPFSLQIVRVANNSLGTILGQYDVTGSLGPTDVKVSPTAGHVYVTDADPNGNVAGQLFEVDTTTTPTNVIKRADGAFLETLPAAHPKVRKPKFQFASMAGGFLSVEIQSTGLVVSTDDGHVGTYDPAGTGFGTLLSFHSFGDGAPSVDTVFDPNTNQTFVSRLFSNTVDTIPGGLSYTGNGFAAGGPLNMPAGVAMAVDPLSSLRYNLTTNIGSTYVGQSVSQILTVTNESAGVITLNGVFIASGSPDFSVDPDPALPFTLQPGSSAIFTIRFTPAVGDTGTKTAVLRVTSTDPIQPVRDFNISGTVLDPNITTVPTGTLAFGSVCVNSSKTLPLDIQNTGTSPLTISSITSAGAAVSFVGPATPVVLVPGAHTVLQVTVTPTVTGSIGPSNITIVSDSGGVAETTTVINITGAGGLSQIALSPTILAFPDTCQGGTKTLPLNVLNNGACDLTLASGTITTNSGTFVLQPFTPNLVIPRGGQTTLYVRFQPTVSGTSNGTLTLTSDSGGVPGTTTNVPLTGGTGAGALSVSPTTLAYGNVCKGVSVTKNLQISNTGNCDLSVTALTLSGLNAADYSVGSSPALPVTVVSGSSVNVPVTLTPSVNSGADNATLTVSAAGVPSVTVPLTANVAPQSIGFSPNSVSFGSVCTSASKTQTVTILNNGGCDLTVTGVAITSGNGVYSVKPVTLPIIIPRGGSAPVEVVFAPTAIGNNQSGTLTFTSDTGGVGDTTTNLPLTGDGPAPSMTVSPTTLAYGNVCKGVSVTKNLQITNTSNCDLSVTALTLSGLNAADYSVGSSPALPVTLVSGSSINVPVTLTPSVNSGADNATLTVSAAGVPNITVPLTANVAPQIVGASPSPLDFGEVCNGRSKTLPLNIQNKGGCDLTVTSVSVPAGPFSVQPLTSPVVIPAGGQSAVLVTFAPTGGTFGAKSATLTVTSDDPATPSFNTGLQGNVGAPDINTSDTSLDFGDVIQGAKKTLPLQIFNQGDCDLTISSISASGTGFSVSQPTFPIVLANGNSVTVQVSYTGTLPPGSKTGTVTILSNDPDSPDLTVALTANVPTPGIFVGGLSTPNTLDFGNVDVTDVPAHTKEITITNTGNGPLHVTGVFFNPATADFSIVEPTPTVANPLTIPAGASVTFHVNFHPTSSDPKTANLVITSDDPNRPTINITVTGSSNTAGLSDLDGGPGLGFPPTVVQQYGKSYTERSAILTNRSLGTLRINSISISGADKEGEFELLGAPLNYPLYLPAGATVAGGNLIVRFHPYQVARTRKANLLVVLGDPISGADLGTVTVPMAGEGVRPGARLLVKRNGNPVGKVQRIELNQFRTGYRALTLDTFDNVKPKNVNLAAPQTSFTYHVEFGGVNTKGSPRGLKPGVYRFVVFMKIGGRTVTKEKQFTVGTTTFTDGIVVNF